LYPQAETSDDVVRTLAAFPLLTRQWHSLRHFRDNITTHAQNSLVLPNAPMPLFRSALSSLAVLGNKPSCEVCLFVFVGFFVFEYLCSAIHTVGVGWGADARQFSAGSSHSTHGAAVTGQHE
jgi:hypothetical protein